eukprot:5167736-Lingulodinium_polyedra.AAC.1
MANCTETYFTVISLHHASKKNMKRIYPSGPRFEHAVFGRYTLVACAPAGGCDPHSNACVATL